MIGTDTSTSNVVIILSMNTSKIPMKSEKHVNNVAEKTIRRTAILPKFYL